MLLEDIHSPQDIKNFSQKQIKQLAQECREQIIKTVGTNGGHLASNLGAVELTIAIHRVFNSPDDAVIWDVSHQCYTHKLLTGRFNEFSTLRQKDGISGFTNKNESPYDYFINGHASTSISSALGLLESKKLEGKSGKVIAVIGDGALTGGLAFEGLCNAGQLNNDLIVIVNDNQMSIDHNTGSISRYLSRLSISSHYQNVRNFIDRAINHIPYLGKHIEKFIFRFKRSLKGLFFTNNLFVDLGFEYTGPIDGHNEKAMEKAFKRISKLHIPVVVHIVTKKGKGYKPAEHKPEMYHGIGPFNVEDGKPNVNKNQETFTTAFGKIITEAAEKDERICAITAAMSKGTGLTEFSENFPKRFFDVGIAEEHAVTFAAGLAEGNLKPVVCIYSTFLQRSLDQIIHDVSLQELPVIFMIDRAGPVPFDGVTHQGIFDIAMLRPVPNLILLSPCSAEDLRVCFEWALNQKKSVAIRYPKLACPQEKKEYSQEINVGRGILVKSDCEKTAKNLIVTTGGMISEVSEAAKNVPGTDIYSLRFLNMIDLPYFTDFASKYKKVLFVEDGVKNGGVSETLSYELLKNGFKNSKILAFENKYYEHGNRQDILKSAGLSSDCIQKELLND